jgi:hypothetical protein
MCDYVRFLLRKIAIAVLIFISLVLLNTVLVSIIICLLEADRPALGSILLLFLSQTLSVAGGIVIVYFSIRSAISFLNDYYLERITQAQTALISRNRGVLRSYLEGAPSPPFGGNPTDETILLLYRSIDQFLAELISCQENLRNLQEQLSSLSSREDNTEPPDIRRFRFD